MFVDHTATFWGEWGGTECRFKSCPPYAIEIAQKKGAAAMEQIIESERYACVRTGMWKKRCKVVIGKQDVGE